MYLADIIISPAQPCQCLHVNLLHNYTVVENVYILYIIIMCWLCIAIISISRCVNENNAQ